MTYMGPPRPGSASAICSSSRSLLFYHGNIGLIILLNVPSLRNEIMCKVEI